MNEKIRDLAISSGIYDSITDPYDKHKTGDHYGSVMDDLERFAELIVRECVRYFNDEYKRDFDVKWREDLSKGIKEHFGVKE